MKIKNLNKIKGREARNKARDEVAEYLEDTILEYISRGDSPVSGQGKFKDLSPKYKKEKGKISGSKKPNLELYGDMLDDFEVRASGSELSIGLHKDSSSEESLLKAERHNHWTKRAKTIGKGKKYPKRQFIPKNKQKFKQEIIDDINDIIQEHIDASENKETS